MTEILIILLLVAINGFFSLSEVALISARKTALQTDAKNGSRAARAALTLQDNPDMYLSTCQIGITVVSILTGIYSGAELSDAFAALLASWGLGAAVARSVAQTIIVIVATYLQVELGELFPKRVGLDIADSLARRVGPFMLALARITKPLVVFLTWNNNVLSALCRLKPEQEGVTEAEVKSIIKQSARSGAVQEVEQDIMERALFLGDSKVASLMTRRANLVTLDAGLSREEAVGLVREKSFANYPVSDGSPENVIGIVSLKDLLPAIAAPEWNLRAVVTEPTYLPESMTVYKALEIFKRDRRNCGLVFDEFGQTSGLIALKDILEGLVGNTPEPDELPDIQEMDGGEGWEVSGACPFYDFLTHFDLEDEYTREFSTVSGLLLSVLRRIPQRGEAIEWKGLTLKVAAMDGARIEKLIVTRTPDA